MIINNSIGHEITEKIDMGVDDYNWKQRFFKYLRQQKKKTNNNNNDKILVHKKVFANM